MFICDWCLKRCPFAQLNPEQVVLQLPNKAIRNPILLTLNPTNIDDQQLGQQQTSLLDSRKVFALRDLQIQRLFNDGVHKDDYYTHQNWQQNCAECNGFFSGVMPPSLLKCGHVCCKQCIEEKYPCACCGVEKEVIIEDYYFLLALDSYQLPKKLLKKQNLYDFQVTIATSFKSILISNQKQSTTVGNILSQFADFVQFEKKTPTTRVAIKNKSYFYSEIKDKSISEFTDIIVNNKTNRCNSITILSHFNGGLQFQT